MTREEAEILAAKLAAEMVVRWQQGERPIAEDFLTRHPQLWEYPIAAADLIYEETCLRQEHGLELPVEQVLHRFPQWRPQLEILFECQRILGTSPPEPQFPATGETLGDFRILHELGRGAQGRVFLASQGSLGDRPVVLKLTPGEPFTAGEAQEHLALARLQHTHIVPVYSVQDFAARSLRLLCMPYLGGATLAQLLEAMQLQNPHSRTGQSVVEALNRVRARGPFGSPELRREGSIPVEPALPRLARFSYVEAVCWIGACLAEALHHAHERGLVHLDLKPSNVLLAADGQPMVLDFHLARGPIRADRGRPPWLGGTAGYMSPEQQAALQAVQHGREVPGPVDHRSDIFSLGLVLYETLGGTLLINGSKRPPLYRSNRQVGVGLADIVDKCLAPNPADRYSDMAALATDLRRHLAHFPLTGVRNRSLIERWRKWRQRRPHRVALAGMMLAVLTAAGAVAVAGVSHFSNRLADARFALNDGQTQIAKKEWQAAISTLQHGLALARGLPFQSGLANDLEDRLRLAEDGQADAIRAVAARELHQLADRVRFLYAADDSSNPGLRRLQAQCRAFWESRDQIVKRLSPDGIAGLEHTVRDDLLDLAIFWADLQVRLSPVSERDLAVQHALAILAEAETSFGPSFVLDEEYKARSAPTRSAVPRAHRDENPPAGPPRSAGTAAPATAWEHYALGRCLLRAADLDGAAEEIARAVHLQPQGLWPNFYQGLCAYRRRQYADAVTAYSVCIGAAPDAAACFYNRAVAFEALGHHERALEDYDQALHLDPNLAVAALNRAMLHYRGERYAIALADLQRARELGADPAMVSFDFALIHLARGEKTAALNDLRQALTYDPHHRDARQLQESLKNH
jgi:serine/threonine protein kinase/Tfp pilus assembly protein PilF